MFMFCRILYPIVKACNQGHKCAQLPISVMVIRRTKDNMVWPSPTGEMSGRLVPDIPDAVESIQLVTLFAQADDQYLIIGSLDKTDFQEEYKSDAASQYKPYIVDPSLTIQHTSRDLEGRITQYLAGGFFLTGTPGTTIKGPIKVSVKYPSSLFNRSSSQGRPTLLSWCEVEEIWIDVAQSCSSKYVPSVDWDNNVMTTYLCDVKSVCSSKARGASKRRKRKADDDGFKGPGSFVLAGATDGIINSPPVIITDTIYTINEDVGSISFVIAANDPYNDEFMFLLDPHGEHSGSVTLAPGGQASYKPCKDCFGVDEVIFIVREVRDDGVTPLETRGLINVTISQVNDNPAMVLVQDGEARTGVISMTMDEFKDSKTDNTLKVVFVSYDVDKDSISITINGNSNGILRLYGQPTPFNISYPDCEQAWSLRKGEWDLAVESILNQNGFTLPVPCGIEADIQGKSLSWISTVVEYTPKKDFLGMDTVQVCVILMIEAVRSS